MGRNHYLTADDAEDKAGWIQHLTDACKITVSTFSVFHLSTCHDYRTHASLLPGKVMFLHLCVILFTGRSLSGGSLSRGALCPGGGGVSVQVGGGSLSGRLPLYDTERAVRILLECILVEYANAEIDFFKDIFEWCTKESCRG